MATESIMNLRSGCEHPFTWNPNKDKALLELTLWLTSLESSQIRTRLLHT
ncbi:hypothetical protein HanPSC8_Chr05g0193451 [Helianthus annuus]|nr:hypothetical protein HanPSC8_Chr05g0193451 [Helianthus annuus]